MEWEEIHEEADLEKINIVSNEQVVLIFKHSTRCAISDTALNRLERSWKDQDAGGIKPFFLDLISHRDISNKIADAYNVKHESPQALLIKNGQCVFHASHLSISFNELVKNI
ncbi:MAG: bacillithiol system redox-active protein YtxJ [Cytophagaceae bacterium]